MSNLEFLADVLPTVGTNRSFEPIPAGEYMVTIRNATMNDTKSYGGKYIKLELEIADGRYSGRRFWENLNVVNNNPQAVEIAQRTLETIRQLCGIQRLNDTDLLIGHTIPVEVTMRKNRETGAMENALRFTNKEQSGVTEFARPSAPPMASHNSATSSAPKWAARASA